jgi:hypothetical protein
VESEILKGFIKAVKSFLRGQPSVPFMPLQARVMIPKHTMDFADRQADGRRGGRMRHQPSAPMDRFMTW